MPKSLVFENILSWHTVLHAFHDEQFLSFRCMAPTAQLVDQRKSHEFKMCKLKLQLQKENIDELSMRERLLKRTAGIR